jgi:hypothetical protein
MRRPARGLLGAVLCLAVVAGAARAGAQSASPPAKAKPSPRPRAAPAAPPRGPDRLQQLAAEVVRSTREYRASLERLLAIYETELANAVQTVEVRKEMHARGALAPHLVEESELALAAARENVEETRSWIAEADHIITEATVAEMISRLAPLPRGGYEETPTLVRFNGPGRWSLAEVPKLREFFAARFGRALPLSALGQTPTHDRIGFDHRNAIDVALHPDSPEGRGLMDFLRATGIPFIAIRGAIAGSATGPHIHVGPPSLRASANR